MARLNMIRVLLIAVSLLLATLGERALGAYLVMPPGGIKPTSGLTMQISSYWVEASGYRPVTFEFTPMAGAAPADRNLSIVFSPDGHFRSRDTQQITFSVKIPQGATSVRKTVSVPQSDIWYQWSVEVFEDGRRLRDLSGRSGIPRVSQSYSWSEAFPSLLFIDRDAPTPGNFRNAGGQMSSQGYDGGDTNLLPNIRRFARFFPPQSNNYQQNLMQAVGTRTPTDGEILMMVENLSSVGLMPPSALPKNWIDYTCLDVIFVSFADLQLTVAEHPQIWLALRESISTGGNLIVHGIGEDFEKLGELEALIRFEAESRADQSEKYPGWSEPSPSRYGASISDLLQTSGHFETYVRGMSDARIITPPRPRPGAKAPPAVFIMRPLGLGHVVAIGPQDFTHADVDQWDWIFAELGRDQWQWYRRHGVSRSRRNADFWNFLIPGVGAAPVKMFLAIITAFVVVIGPVNYWFLRRSRRLYLLLLTVPSGAGVITLCLFAYALLSDGLGTRVRLRSYTEISDGSNTAVSWSRQSYYAGMAPSEGLAFPANAAIYPIDDAPRQENSRTRITRWDDEQNLAVGYIRSRSLSQLMVVNSTPSKLRVVVNSTASGLSSTNQLDVPVTHLLVCDDNRYFWTEELAVGESAEMIPISRQEVLEKLDDLKTDHRPVLPHGFVQPRISRRYRYYYYNDSDRQFPNPNVATSILERKLRSISDLPPSEPRVYFAMTEAAPSSVPVGVKRARQEAGFHVVKGTW